MDGSKRGWGAVLLQVHDSGQRQIVGWASGKFNKAGLSYGPTKGELWALKEGCRKFDLLLRGRKFKVETDCQALCHNFENIVGDRHGYMSVWANDLKTFYDFKISHVPGKDMVLVDAFCFEWTIIINKNKIKF